MPLTVIANLARVAAARQPDWICGPDFDQMACDIKPSMLAKGRERSGRADPFSPVGAADESALKGFHHLRNSDNGRHRISVAHGFGKDRHVRNDSVVEVGPSRLQSPSGGNFINDQNRPDARGDAPNALQEARLEAHRSVWVP